MFRVVSCVTDGRADDATRLFGVGLLIVIGADHQER